MKYSFFIILLLLLTCSCKGWGEKGHNLIANLAYNNLTEPAKSNFGKFFNNSIPILNKFSTWADHVRETEEYKWSSNYHFIDIVGDILEYCELNITRDCADGNNIYYALHNYTNRLLNNSNDEEALKFVIHFYGDIFQPLHIGYKLDRGGNDLELIYKKYHTNLHMTWDDELIYNNIDNLNKSYDNYLNYLDSLVPTILDNTKNDLYYNIANSSVATICQGKLYYNLDEKIKMNDVIGDDYYNEKIDILNNRLKTSSYYLSKFLHLVYG